MAIMNAYGNDGISRADADPEDSDLADSLGSTLTEAGARAILTLKLNGPTPERRQELAGKANEGLLTAEEFAECEIYAQLPGLLAALQSKGATLPKAIRAGMTAAQREAVRQRAGGRCEYCRLPDSAMEPEDFHVEHIIAKKGVSA
jgi:hypothetical protein